MSFQSVILIGNTTDACKSIETKTGMPMCTTSLAVNEVVKGEKQVQFFNLTFFGKQAEIAQKYIAKGQKLFVSCKMRYNKEKKLWNFVVNEFQMLSTGSKEEFSHPEPAKPTGFSQPQARKVPTEPDDLDFMPF